MTAYVAKGRAAIAALAAFTLAGCISFGPDAPEQLLTLSAASSAPAGSSSEGDMSRALAVKEPSVPQRLNVTRVPVMMTDTSIAYLQDAVWVEKPSRLFQTVLSDTIRARGTRLVVGGADLEYAAPVQLDGTLTAMDFDAARGSVVVRYEAVLTQPGGTVRTRIFENEVTGIIADPLSVGPALNQAANAVAAEVADWVG